MEFTAKEKEIIKIVQSDLPESLTPFKDIADKVGVSEEDVLVLLRRLEEDKTIRRFGASIKHQRTGYSSNAMVAWRIADDLIDEAGAIAAENRNISHCYHRPSTAPDWPYTLFTMIHGKSDEECMEVVETLRQTTNLDEYAILKSVEELKKISMVYYDD